MRTLLFLALLAFGMNAGAQSLEPSQVAIQPIVLMSVDSQALVVLPNGAGILSVGMASMITKIEGKNSLMIGDEGETEWKGIVVTDNGESIYINASKVVILRSKFNSHAEADAELATGQEYYLNGDRGVYRKP